MRPLRAILAGLVLAPALGAQSLAKRLDRLLDAPPYDRHHWGIVVLDTTGKVLYGRNATRLFVPASNTKLVVSAVATVLLPPDGTVATSVYAAGPMEDGIVRGDLVLYGRGDPTMSRRCYDADTTRAGGAGISRISESAVMVLPQPDSPTIPSVSPGARSKLTPSTARTAPTSR